MIRFLRLFAEYREMELELQRARDDAAQCRLRCATLDVKVDHLNEQIRIDAHKVADTFSTYAIGKRVFSKADPPPAEMANEVKGPPVRRWVRSVQAEQIKQTEEQLKKMWDEAS